MDPTGNDRIRYRIAPESDVFLDKTCRIRPGFHRIPCGQIPDRITPEKIPSVPVKSDHRIISNSTGSCCRKISEETRFWKESEQISSDFGNRPTHWTASEKLSLILPNLLIGSCQNDSNVVFVDHQKTPDFSKLSQRDSRAHYNAKRSVSRFATTATLFTIRYSK